MDEFLTYQRRLAAVILLILALGSVAMGVTLPGGRSFLPGWLVGGFVGFVIFRLRVLHILNLSRLPQEAWGKASIKNSYLSLVLMAGALILCACVPGLNAFAALGGILVERLVLIGDGLLRPSALCGQPRDADGAHDVPRAGDEATTDNSE